jgi:hypothetical protein
LAGKKEVKREDRKMSGRGRSILLSFLSKNSLPLVKDSLSLVGFGESPPPDVRRFLSDFLKVLAFDKNGRRVGTDHLQGGGKGKENFMGIAQPKKKTPTFRKRGSIPYPYQLEARLEPLAKTFFLLTKESQVGTQPPFSSLGRGILDLQSKLTYLRREDDPKRIGKMKGSLCPGRALEVKEGPRPFFLKRQVDIWAKNHLL